jgi:hypothetical protein
MHLINRTRCKIKIILIPQPWLFSWLSALLSPDPRRTACPMVLVQAEFHVWTTQTSCRCTGWMDQPKVGVGCLWPIKDTVAASTLYQELSWNVRLHLQFTLHSTAPCYLHFTDHPCKVCNTASYVVWMDPDACNAIQAQVRTHKCTTRLLHLTIWSRYRAAKQTAVRKSPLFMELLQSEAIKKNSQSSHTLVLLLCQCSSSHP